MSSRPPADPTATRPGGVRRLLPATLTHRLVAVVVALVAVVGVLIGTITTIAMHRQLMQRLDGDVRDLVGSRVVGGIASANQGPGSLLVLIPADGPSSDGQGGIATPIRDKFLPISAKGMAQLANLPVGPDLHTVNVPGRGTYRVAATTIAFDTGSGPTLYTVVRGLPLADVDNTIHNLVWWEVALTLTGVLVAAGAGTLVVRRQLRPLREVAGTAHTVARLPLASGDVGVTSRVPERLTDEATEVGQVGAALNTLLEHVESSLAARHRSEQQVRQFVADASHELRTPLATIHGYAELSRRTPDDADRLSTALAKVETEADRMSALVEDLLLLARLDAGRPLATEEVDVTRVLLEAVGDARVIAPDHHWRLELPDEPLTATGDTARVHQVVTNLLSNARTHTPAGTTVLVAASGVNSHVEIRVHDDGPGLPAELLPHAFERFTRGDSSRTRSSGGAGLGLSLVAAIVTAQGGTVDLASTPGSTTFTVTLPAAG
jgi:two-component system OmpR family sensor kinase